MITKKRFYNPNLCYDYEKHVDIAKDLGVKTHQKRK
jgi:hypothetical protein